MNQHTGAYIDKGTKSAITHLVSIKSHKKLCKQSINKYIKISQAIKVKPKSTWDDALQLPRLRYTLNQLSTGQWAHRLNRIYKNKIQFYKIHSVVNISTISHSKFLHNCNWTLKLDKQLTVAKMLQLYKPQFQPIMYIISKKAVPPAFCAFNILSIDCQTFLRIKPVLLQIFLDK